MKNPQPKRILPGDLTSYTALVGFSGYYVTAFNQILSTRTNPPRAVKILSCTQGKYTVDRVTLFDDNGKRCQRSRRKLLIDTFGLEEFERREVGFRDQMVQHAKRQSDKAKRAESLHLKEKADWALFKQQVKAEELLGELF